MPDYQRPGAYIEEVLNGTRSIQGITTANAAFVGQCMDGPIGTSRMVTGFREYQDVYGGIRDTDQSPLGDPMGHAVHAFFLNGGNRAFIFRVASDEAGPASSLNDYLPIFESMTQIREIDIIGLPGQAWSASVGDPGRLVLEHAIAHAEALGDRMVLLDPPVDLELRTRDQVDALGLPTSSHVAVYYPWLHVSNPHFGAAGSRGAPPTVLVAPSGFAAGLWARSDAERGVWKAPAGLEATLRGVRTARFVVGDAEQNVLNPLGINCYRRMNGSLVSWGARTRASVAQSQWRYVSGKRMGIFLHESIVRGTQWARFEHNDHRLWHALRYAVGAFMDTQFRAGAFQGAKADDACFVRCGLGETMSQADIDAGRVIMLVGFAPLRPAEFVVIRIEQRIDRNRPA